jgi:hypothetical protein
MRAEIVPGVLHERELRRSGRGPRCGDPPEAPVVGAGLYGLGGVEPGGCRAVLLVRRVASRR